MKTYKADPIGNRVTHGHERIEFCLDLPVFEQLGDWAALADAEAVKIEGALHRNLPGGVYDRLLALMCKRTASLLRVNHRDAGGS